MTQADTRPDASDIRTGRLDRLLPAAAIPYAHLARLDRPIGTWLLLFPCWWGTALALAADPARLGWETLLLFPLFAVGALAMRGAGCTYNDIVDRDIDGRVARTALRPIPSGRVSARAAWIFLAAQLAVGAAVLFSLPAPAIWVGLGSIPVVALYPFMKRVTHWPQAVLGLAFNWGALVGWTAVAGGLHLPALLAYAAGIVWTLGYDTIYAHQDKEDDAIVGVRSTALLFGDATRIWLWGFYGATVLLLAAAGLAAGLPAAIWLVALLPAAAQLAWQVAALRQDDAQDCLAKFRANRWAGWLVLAAIAVAGSLA